MKRTDVAALCVDPIGPYPSLVAEWWDESRDVRTFDLDLPVVAHPPCGPWSTWLRHQCKRQHEAPLGPLCVSIVRRNGGVLEHPAFSHLFAACEMPAPGMFPDRFGGLTVECTLSMFGADVYKRTWLYIVPGVLPQFPDRRRAVRIIHDLSSRRRAITPEPMARWLLDLASTRAGARELVA